MAQKKFSRTLVTSALPYANGEIHLGHLAGAYLPADIYVRFLRMRGEEVLYICGSDEYGVPITLTAEKLGITPKELVDANHASIKKSFEGFGMSFDNFSQTSRDIHTRTAQEFFSDLHGQGLFKQKTTDQYYSPTQKPISARPLHRGHLPGLRIRGRPRRRVRKLHLDLQHHRADRSGQRPGQQLPSS